MDKNNTFERLVFLLLFLSTTLSVEGQLQYEGFIFDGLGSPFTQNITALALSPDEDYLYSTSLEDEAITVFQRNVATGDLLLIATYKNGVEGVSGLEKARDIVVSPDGNHVYAVGEESDALVLFERDQAN